ncbi:MAG: PAS domain-containing protein [Desulfuromonadaceae bacterium]|nr:PAS domain-containing protein [Desulfuromonadaceae bacterium]
MDTFTGFLNNAALMLILCVIYDTFGIFSISRKNLRDSLTGVLVGLICIAVMLNPWSLERGLYFDTRWVLLSLCGLYFGFVPTAIAVVFAGAFRLYQGGPGGIIGTVVIVSTACTGLAWGYWKDKHNKRLNWLHLYVFGVVIQLTMLSCMFLFPVETRNTIIKKIALPILLIYPILTLIIGLILKKQEDRRATEKELAESRQALKRERGLLRGVINSIPDLIFFKNIDGVYLGCNKSFEQFVGYEEQSVVGKTDFDLFNKDVAEFFVQKDRLVYKSGRPESNEEWVDYPDGKKILLDTIITPLKDIDETLYGLVGISRDITERKKNEEALSNSERFLKTVIDSEPECIKLLNIDGNLILMNPAGLEMIQADSFDQVKGQCVFPLVTNQHRDDFIALTKQIFQGITGTLLFETIGLKGRHIWLETHAVPFRDEQGNITALLGITRDVTERKLNEQRMSLLLAISHYTFTTEQDFLDHALQLVLTLTGSTIGYIYFYNEQTRQFTLNTWSHEVMKECAVMEQKTVYNLDSTGIWGEAVRQRKSVMLNEFQASNPLKKGLPEGHVTLKRFLTVPVVSEEKIIAVVGVANKASDYLSADEMQLTLFMDTVWKIVSSKRAEAEQKKLEQQLLHAQKLESLGVLAGGIAHDFNNILTSIIGNAELALMRINPESPAIDNLYSIEKASARAADLAKQMLAYSGKGKFVICNHDINGLLEEMLHILQVSISKKAVLRLNLTHPLPSVEADATQIRQIIMNLVINASEAIGDKSGVIAINTGCMDCDRSYLRDVWLDENIGDGLYVYIEIADTGCGMSRDTLAKLFDPFFTTKFTGRGLGMAAVLGIVRGHKGAIKVYSELDKGSSFKILLPASAKPSEIFNYESKNDQWKGTGTVLLVDDEETVRGIGSEMLKELGFNVVTANDGHEAIEIYKLRTDISFVILDLTMPHIDGEQCFRELRMLDPDVKVIMSSGFNELEVTQKFVGKGLAGFIQKPYKLSVLRDGIIGLYPKSKSLI